jgi:quercetin dioxygenase-like cupin family protein
MTTADGSVNHPFHVRSSTSPRYTFREYEFRFLVTGEQSGGSYSLIEIASPAGSGPGPHVHDEAEEHFVVLEGELDFRVGDLRFTATKGDLVHVPRGVVHAFTVSSSRALTLATYTPAGEEIAFMEAGVLVDD